MMSSESREELKIDQIHQVTLDIVKKLIEICDEIHQNAGDGKCLSRERVWRVMLLVLLSLMFGMVGSGSFLYANY